MSDARERQEMRHTLRKGLPRFVVFIMWDEVDWGGSAAGMAGERENEEERQRKGGRAGEKGGGGTRGGWRREEESGEKMRTNDDKERRAPARNPLATQIFDLNSHVSCARETGPSPENAFI